MASVHERTVPNTRVNHGGDLTEQNLIEKRL